MPSRANAIAVLATLGRDVRYTAPGAPTITIRAVLREKSATLSAPRAAGRIASYDASATVSSNLAVSVGGTIEADGAVYRVDHRQVSRTPGLTDLGLVRLSGPATEHDPSGFASAVLGALGETVLIDGLPVLAHVERAGVFLEAGDGREIESVRTVVSVSSGVAEAALVGSEVVVEGETLRVREIAPGGHGLTRLILEES